MWAMSFDQIWETQDAHVASGRIPGYAAAVRIGGRTEVHAGGRMAVESDSPPMRDDTLFRIASVTKPIGGAPPPAPRAAGGLALHDPLPRRLPPPERPPAPPTPGAAPAA